MRLVICDAILPIITSLYCPFSDRYSDYLTGLTIKLKAVDGEDTNKEWCHQIEFSELNSIDADEAMEVTANNYTYQQPVIHCVVCFITPCCFYVWSITWLIWYRAVILYIYICSRRYFREEVFPWFFQFMHQFHVLIFYRMKSISD